MHEATSTDTTIRRRSHQENAGPRLIKQILEYIESVNNMKWITEVVKDLKNAVIAHLDRETFKHKEQS